MTHDLGAVGKTKAAQAVIDPLRHRLIACWVDHKDFPMLPHPPLLALRATLDV
jgi:hypothetical protein